MSNESPDFIEFKRQLILEIRSPRRSPTQPCIPRRSPARRRVRGWVGAGVGQRGVWRYLCMA